jgi:hypothetical protein
VLFLLICLNQVVLAERIKLRVFITTRLLNSLWLMLVGLVCAPYIRVVLVCLRIGCSFTILSKITVILVKMSKIARCTYNIEWLKHVLHMFEFFGFKSCINSIDHVVVCLLLLLLILGEFLEVFFPK